jgi:ATP adenylyltransferase
MGPRFVPVSSSAQLTCDFCRHITAGPARPEDWAIVAEDPEFVAVPSIGALIPGWMLVVPRRHALSLVSLDEGERQRLWRFVRATGESVAADYGPVTLFEHGPACSGHAAGCGIDHAHLHVVPTGDLDLLRGAQTHLPELQWRAVSDLDAAQEAVDVDEDYLFLETPSRERWLSTGHAIPSQAFRRVIAAELGCPGDFNWRSHPQLDVVKRTIERALKS